MSDGQRLRPDAAVRDALLAAVAEGRASTSVIAGRAGIDTITAGRYLRWMEDRGTVERSNRLWSIPLPDRPAPRRARRPYGRRSMVRGPRPSTLATIGRALDEGPATQSELVERVGMSKQVADTALRWLHAKGEAKHWVTPEVRGRVWGWARDMPEGAATTNRELILQALTAWRSPAEVERATGMETASVRANLRQLKADGMVVSQRGFYKSAEQPAETR